MFRTFRTTLRHVTLSALTHEHRSASAARRRLRRRKIMTEEVKAEHTIAEHQHGGPDCTHEPIPHDDHVDYLHDGHRHAEHEDHYDEH